MQGIRKPRYVVLDSQMMHGGINMSGIVQKENSFIKTLDEIGKIRYVRKKMTQTIYCKLCLRELEQLIASPGTHSSIIPHKRST